MGLNKVSWVENWLLWLAVISLCSSFLISVCSAKSSISMGSRYAIHGVPDREEKQKASTVAGLIASLAAMTSWDEIRNWYGAQTTEEHIYDAASGLGESYSTTWHIGHGKYRDVWIFPPFYNERHWDMVTDDGTWVPDDWIYQCTGDQNNKFVFLWSCRLGDVIGGQYFFTGAHGMPYCWLHTSDLSGDGYANPYGNGLVFIGWKGEAVSLTSRMLGVWNAPFYFLLEFYGQAFFGLSIIESLDYAADEVFGDDSFAYCVFYKGFESAGEWYQMVVYGDGDLVLPYE